MYVSRGHLPGKSTKGAKVHRRALTSASIYSRWPLGTVISTDAVSGDESGDGDSSDEDEDEDGDDGSYDGSDI